MKRDVFIVTVLMVGLILMTTLSGVAAEGNRESPSHVQAILLSGPECWTEAVSVTGKGAENQLQTVQRVSTYEIHDDDSVNPNHELSGLPYYSSLTWQGSVDVEWLVLEGNFSYYEIDSELHQVTFYDLQDWLHIVYRTHNFVQRTPDQIRFCVIGQNGGDYWNTQARVLYPANYQLQSATPPGYFVPAAGEIQWDFGTITEFMVDTYFAGLGPDRPLLDFPVDYRGRAEGSSTGFTATFNTRITSKFDHEYPNYSDNDWLLPYTGVPVYNPGGVWACDLGVSCYDGHDAYDIDDRCPAQAPCSDPSAVYAAAEGEITQAGWLDNVGGCQIVVDHGDGWTTLYAHLRDSHNDHSCDGILRESGLVSRLDQIGIIGESGSGAEGTHLHFAVRHSGVVVDPSGWEPNPQVSPDPWADHPSGAASYPMWLYSIRTTQALDPSSGGQLASPTHEILATVPPGFYGDQLMFNLSSAPVAGTSAHLVNTGHSFSLTAMDDAGDLVHQLDAYLTLQVSFDMTDTQGIDPGTLSLYTWDQTMNTWLPIATTIDWEALAATAYVNHLSTFALMGKSQHIVFLPIVARSY